MEAQELMVRRGPDGNLVIKKETDSQPCVYAVQEDSALGQGYSGSASSNYLVSDHLATGASPLARPESYNVGWAVPSNPGTWRQDDSMSSFDLEMDKEPSIVPYNQVLSPPSMPDYSKGGFPSQFGHHGDIDFSQKKYMHENNLRRYDGEENDGITNQQHQVWQQNIQNQQAKSSVVTTATPDVMIVEETYTFELDEFGEG